MKAARSFWTTALWTALIFVPAGVLAQGHHSVEYSSDREY